MLDSNLHGGIDGHDADCDDSGGFGGFHMTFHFFDCGKLLKEGSILLIFAEKLFVCFSENK